MKRISKINNDAFSVLCGNLIGQGQTRTVYECRTNPEWVVKVELKEGPRRFHNITEFNFWNDWQFAPEICKWLAPCRFLSTDGYILIQERAEPIDRKNLPKKLPEFLTDRHTKNYGTIKGQVVCVDYAATVVSANKKLTKVSWDDV